MSSGQGVEISDSAESQSVEQSYNDDTLSIGTIASEDLRKFRRYDTSESKSDQDGYIYVLRSGKFFKIGKTVDPHGRFMQISPVMPEKVELVFLFYSPTMNTAEATLHDRFNAKRVNGEWFVLDRDDIEFLGQYRLETKPLILRATNLEETGEEFEKIKNLLQFDFTGADFSALELICLGHHFSTGISQIANYEIFEILNDSRRRSGKPFATEVLDFGVLQTTHGD